MKSLFILQLVCCVITAMLALQLAMASLQVRWKVWRYEISRWILVASMLFFSVHYLLQMYMFYNHTNKIKKIMVKIKLSKQNTCCSIIL